MCQRRISKSLLNQFKINMTGTLIYTLLFILLKGSCKGVLITQWPKYISSFKSTSVDMHCYQNDTDYQYTYWYRQIEGKELVLIATYLARNPSYETGFGKGFKVWGSETKKWSLTVDVEEDSDAVYLCAASFHRTGKVAKVEGRKDKAKDRAIGEENLFYFARDLRLGLRFTCQQDNNPKNTDKATLELFKTKNLLKIPGYKPFAIFSGKY
ncbi:uncharacterized protein LOC117598265 [Pangasianodon hypophthalmus]|uniref:uncharacterized protein LOC117598265 n=1 Tax=Pangasianodon hypophthalmus TaxID=310915 RepID=UPI002307B204|nr:uncharacterized protein LOC117598265 [Pangasianodon hypophthalmus]